MDWLDQIGNDGLQLAQAATKAGAVDIQSDITGLNLTAVQNTALQTQQSNSQLILLAVIAFIFIKYVKL